MSMILGPECRYQNAIGARAADNIHQQMLYEYLTSRQLSLTGPSVLTSSGLRSVWGFLRCGETEVRWKASGGTIM